jgi:hypothetical protein
MAVILDDEELQGVDKITGWLILPTIGLVLGILREGREVWMAIRAFVTEASLETLFPVAIGVPWLLFMCIVAAFFFRKHRWAPYFYIALLCGYVAFGGLYLLVHVVGRDAETADAPKEFIRTVVGAGIWVPYFLKSRRVKLTFVNSW